VGSIHQIAAAADYCFDDLLRCTANAIRDHTAHNTHLVYTIFAARRESWTWNGLSRMTATPFLYHLYINSGWFGVAVTAFVTSAKLSYVEPG